MSNHFLAFSLATLFVLTLAPLPSVSQTVSADSTVGDNHQEGVEEASEHVGSDGFENDLQRFSYVTGYRLVEELQGEGSFDEIDLKLTQDAFAAAFQGKACRLDAEQTDRVFSKLMNKIQTKREARHQKEYDLNLAKEAAYLEANKRRDGVQETPSGLQYEILVPGTGSKATGNDWSCSIQYQGTLIDGTEFERTVSGEPEQIHVGDLTEGLAEGIPLISEGGTIRLHIPSKLAFGRFPDTPGGPGATLIYTVELVKLDAVPTPQETIENIRSRLEEEIKNLRSQAQDAVDHYQDEIDAAEDNQRQSNG